MHADAFSSNLLASLSLAVALRRPQAFEPERRLAKDLGESNDEMNLIERAEGQLAEFNYGDGEEEEEGAGDYVSTVLLFHGSLMTNIQIGHLIMNNPQNIMC